MCYQNSCDVTCVVLLIYRPGSDHVSQQFFKDLSRILTYLSTLSAPIIITGDINIRLDRLDDPSCWQFNDLIASFDLKQNVTQPTHDLGRILDAAVTRSDLPAPDVSVIDVGLSDHRMVRWCLDLEKPTPLYEHTPSVPRGASMLTNSDQRYWCHSCVIWTSSHPRPTWRRWRSVTLLSSPDILDRLAPPVETTRRKRKSDLWFDEECRRTKGTVRKLERRYKKTNQAHDRAAWIAALCGMHRNFRIERSNFSTERIASQKNNPRKLLSSIDTLFGDSHSTYREDGVQCGRLHALFRYESCWREEGHWWCITTSLLASCTINNLGQPLTADRRNR